MLVPLLASILIALITWAAVITLPALAFCRILSRAIARIIKGK